MSTIVPEEPPSPSPDQIPPGSPTPPGHYYPRPCPPDGRKRLRLLWIVGGFLVLLFIIALAT